MDALRESKDQTADIKAALDALAESDGYLFDAAPADEGGTGITASTGGEHGDGGKPEPRNLRASRMQMEGDGV